MAETRESCLAAILARGLIRVRRRAERAGLDGRQADEQSQPTAPELPGDYRTAVFTAAGSPQGDER